MNRTAAVIAIGAASAALLVVALTSSGWFLVDEQVLRGWDRSHLESAGGLGDAPAAKAWSAATRWLGWLAVAALLVGVVAGALRARPALVVIASCALVASLVAGLGLVVAAPQGVVMGSAATMFLVGCVTGLLVCHLAWFPAAPPSAPREVGPTEAGTRHGRWLVYDDQGRLARVDFYERGRRVRHALVGSDGRLGAEIVDGTCPAPAGESSPGGNVGGAG